MTDPTPDKLLAERDEARAQLRDLMALKNSVHEEYGSFARHVAKIAKVCALACHSELPNTARQLRALSEDAQRLAGIHGLQDGEV